MGITAPSCLYPCLLCWLLILHVAQLALSELPENLATSKTRSWQGCKHEDDVVLVKLKKQHSCVSAPSDLWQIVVRGKRAGRDMHTCEQTARQPSAQMQQHFSRSSSQWPTEFGGMKCESMCMPLLLSCFCFCCHLGCTNQHLGPSLLQMCYFITSKTHSKHQGNVQAALRELGHSPYLCFIPAWTSSITFRVFITA